MAALYDGGPESNLAGDLTPQSPNPPSTHTLGCIHTGSGLITNYILG